MQDEIAFKITGIFNKMVNFECPGCHVPLSTALNDAGNIDECPHCGNKFTSPGREMLESRAAINEKKKSAAAYVAALKQKAKEKLDAPLATPVASAATNPNPSASSVCSNCERKIGNLEKLKMWGASTVCYDCYERLSHQNGEATSPAHDVPAPSASVLYALRRDMTLEKESNASRGLLILIAVVLTIGVGVFLVIVVASAYSGYQLRIAAEEKSRAVEEKSRIKLVESGLELTHENILGYLDEHNGQFPKDLQTPGVYFGRDIQYVGGDLPPMSENYRLHHDDLIRDIIVCYEQDPNHPNHLYVVTIGGYVDYIVSDSKEEPLLWKQSNDARAKFGLNRLPLPSTFSK